MPRKMARSGCQTRFGLAEALMAVHTLYLSCGKAGKAPIPAPVRESSGEYRVKRRNSYSSFLCHQLKISSHHFRNQRIE